MKIEATNDHWLGCVFVSSKATQDDLMRGFLLPIVLHMLLGPICIDRWKGSWCAALAQEMAVVMIDNLQEWWHKIGDNSGGEVPRLIELGKHVLPILFYELRVYKLLLSTYYFFLTQTRATQLPAGNKNMPWKSSMSSCASFLPFKININDLMCEGDCFPTFLS